MASSSKSSLPTRDLGRTAAVLLTIAGLALVANPVWSGPPPPGFSDDIQVRFAPGADVSPPIDALPPALAAQVASITPLFTLSTAALDALRAASANLPDLTLWFEIELVGGADPGDFLAELQAQANVDVAEFTPLDSPDPAITPDFTGNQGYLGPAPAGIDAQFSWTIPGGDGTGIRIYDVERAWQQTHEDLSKAAGVVQLLDPGDSNTQGNNSHGTAVLGELVGDNDTKGVTGISFGASVGLAPRITTNLGNNVANALLLAAADAQPGDVILLETQTSVCGQGGCNGTTQNGCGPSEWTQSVFDATQTAVANRINVVAAAGNGNVDLDMAACNSLFDRTQRDSGAIIVGAGGSAGSGNDRERLGFSSYGSRVDVQGWGDGVMTTGYGTGYVDPDDPTNPDKWYANSFGGTSSASPIVSGAVANLQGIAKQTFGVPLLPFQVRSILRDTGSPQLGDTSENIGPLPDLQSAIGQISAGAIDLFILVDTSASFTDDLPIFKAQAPDIIAGIQAMNANVRFGIGRFEDYPINPFGDPGDVAYTRLVDLTFVDLTSATDPVLTAIDGLSTTSGGDFPESQLVALFQAATGAGQDLSGQGQGQANIPSGQNANFRDGATKLFLLWTDASFHLNGDAGDIPYPGPTFVEVVEAIEALDPPQVIGISSGGGGVADLEAIAAATGAIAPDTGVDCDANGSVDISAGDPIVCEIASSGEGIAEAIVSVVEAVVAAATPIAMCMDVATTTDPGECSAADVSIDDGSSDPDGGPLVRTQAPGGPYPVGDSAVTLKVTDDMGLSDFCVATVTVVDDELPELSCNVPSVTPPDAPISITGTATDNCEVASVVLSEPDCFKFTTKGKRIDKTKSCVFSVGGSTITILDTGGVGTHISWKLAATDENGNTNDTDCEVVIGNPGDGS
jgi:hypothetical protein